jgi:hypothetical protein
MTSRSYVQNGVLSPPPIRIRRAYVVDLLGSHDAVFTYAEEDINNGWWIF